MFAVPGWAVAPSALKQQTEHLSQSQLSPKSPNSGFKSKKRKRRREVEGNVASANVDEMWKRHIEGQALSLDKTDAAKSRKDKKRRKKAENKATALEKRGEDMGKESSAESRKNKSKSGKDLSALKTTSPEHNRKPDRDVTPKDKETPKKLNKKSNFVGMQNDGSLRDTPGVSEVPPTGLPPTSANLTPLQQSMRQKLLSARFRHLNQTLYTSSSSQSLELFTANPELFAEYHAGFSRQVKELWPSNPVDEYIRTVKTRGALLPQQGGKGKPGKNGGPPATAYPLPRRPHGLCTIADLGCGDAQLSRAINPSVKALNLKVLSFDFHASNSFVTKADISALPVADGTLDVAIFCLSLMGTNWISFIEEAWRVLRSDGRGECWVSEVKSRFGKITRQDIQTENAKALGAKGKLKNKKSKSTHKNNDNGDIDGEIFAEDMRGDDGADGDRTDISAFVEVFRTRGFMLRPESVDKSNKMFAKMEFVKRGAPTRGRWSSTNGAAQFGKFTKKKFIDKTDLSDIPPEDETMVLKPCVYKTR